jgi:TPR repeat protein
MAGAPFAAHTTSDNERDHMKIASAIAASLVFAGALAAPLTTPEFEALLKKNYELKRQGRSDLGEFLVSARAIADKGDAAAQYMVGMILVKMDPSTSKEYLSKSAKAGCAGSKTLLGVLYMQEKNSEGVPLLAKAAAEGDATAQAIMSGAYLRGDGVEKSPTKAYTWLKLAERQSFSNGAGAAIQDGLSKIEKQMSTADKAEADKQFALEAKRVPVVNYVFCGQANPDTSKAKNVPEYLRM